MHLLEHRVRLALRARRGASERMRGGRWLRRDAQRGGVRRPDERARYPLCRQVELLERVEPLVGISAHEPAHARDALAELADLGKVADTGWHLRAACQRRRVGLAKRPRH